MPAERDGVLLETQLRQKVSSQRLWRDLVAFSQFRRDSGSADERAAVRYVADALHDFDIPFRVLEFDAFVSQPLAASVVFIHADGRPAQEVATRPRAFGAATPPAGLEAELAHVPSAVPPVGSMIFSHHPVSGDYSGLDVAGKIVVTSDGGPDGVARAQARGAVGHIHIWPSDENVVHEMISSSVWGTPTPASKVRLPAIPSLGMTHNDGARVLKMLMEGPTRARLTADVATGWKRLPLVVADIPGAESESFLLVGAHIDSWYEGVTDNATGDVALIEMARILSEQKDRLRRGVRLCWWPGHSNGRYAGSTWYADTHFNQLRKRAIGYLNIDSPGVRDSQNWDCRYNTGEIEHVTASVVRDLTGQEPSLRRPVRAADQSFLGIGLPSLGAYRMLPIDHADRKAVGGSGGGFWWHTPLDTLDKADPEILAGDVQIYLTLCVRMCDPVLLPYRFERTAQDYCERLTVLQNAGSRRLDLAETIGHAQRFQAAVRNLAAEPVRDVERLNAGLLQITRLVNPLLFTINGPYEMDPALQLPVLPGLSPILDLDPNDHSDDARFLLTALLRQRNRIEEGLSQATEMALSLDA